jgi:methylthioribose-1-phosphate isomerase
MEKLALSLPSELPIPAVYQAVENLAKMLYEEDLETCKAIGRHGADLVPSSQKVTILTHCNTGSLATAGYGTALGVIRSLAERGQVSMVYADETRPWLQGARLTAFELRSEGIPYKVIADSAAAYLMQLRRVDLVIVGADRIASNGDTANKIGTYNLAVQCRHHGVPFYVAAPLSTFDFTMASGAEIAIEERSPGELRALGGRQLTPSDAPVWNPSFDVTPGELIAGIITEKGVLRPPYIETIKTLKGS